MYSYVFYSYRALFLSGVIIHTVRGILIFLIPFYSKKIFYVDFLIFIFVAT